MARRASPTTKISIAITAEDLETLRARARRLHGGNLSAAVAEATAKLRREEAGYRLLELLGVPPLSDEEFERVEAELASLRVPEGKAPAKRKKRSRTKVAA